MHPNLRMVIDKELIRTRVNTHTHTHTPVKLWCITDNPEVSGLNQ